MAEKVKLKIEIHVDMHNLNIISKRVRIIFSLSQTFSEKKLLSCPNIAHTFSLSFLTKVPNN